MRSIQIRRIVFAALFAAIASVLKIYSLQVTPDWRISIFAIPLLLSGFYLGPIYGLAVGFVADTVYIVISPYASFWGIYTISTMIWGLSGALIKKFRPYMLIIIMVITLTSLAETTINTVAMLVEGGDWVYVLSNLPRRLITMILRLPFLIFTFRVLITKFEVMELGFS